LLLTNHRFSRLDAISWWDRTRLADARVLVVGAGALGNEVLKNLALIGLGRVAVIDRDRVEAGNLTRSVLFRAEDVGRPKAEVAAAMMRAIYPEARVVPIQGDLIAEVGVGWLAWADIVIGAVDNREARLFVNEHCARLGVPWIDGGIEVFNGIARGFVAHQGACYACTMGKRDWDAVDQQRSCSIVARRAAEAGGVPTTPTTASVIGAIQVQEAVKFLHGMAWLAGRGVFFDGESHQSYPIDYAQKPGCPFHEPITTWHPLPVTWLYAPLKDLVDTAREALGGCTALDFSREIVTVATCPSCGHEQAIWRGAGAVSSEQLMCSGCDQERFPRFIHGIAYDDPLIQRSPRAIGLMPSEIVWARHGEHEIGYRLGDPEARFEARGDE